jgi:sodium-dependent dicarboxylate transporter 2/3/5
MGIPAIVLIMTNFIINVAAIALSVDMVNANHLGIASVVIVCAFLVTAGMRLVQLIGAALNAIAYDSRQSPLASSSVTAFP